MKKNRKAALPFFRIGYIVKGGSAAKLYRLIGETRLNAADMCEKQDGVRLTIPMYNKRCFLRLCRQNGFEAEKTGEGDMVRAVRRIVKRPALIISLLLVFAVLIYLKDIVMRFDIMTDDDKLRTEIMNVLKEEGVCAGSYIPDIDLVVVERALKQRVAGISWAGITRKGNSLIIDIVENIPAEKGSYSRFPSNLVAKENAVVDKVLLLDGQLKTVVGSGVRKGDIIVSGIVERTKTTWKDGKQNVESFVRYTNAIGTVEGTFERTVVFEQALDDVVKKETGNVYKQRYLHLFSADIPLFFKAKTGDYYSDNELSSAKLAGRTLPFGIRTLTLREYDRKPVHYSLQQAQQLAEQKCRKYEQNFLEEYKIKDKKVSVKSDEKCVRIEVTYKLYGNICEQAAFFIKK